ncbi:hypothetical protein [Kalamiella sp. sgz302252]|uniref:hypothetical protein n=1 Tax=Pantoea sp. sgz302252 TaxID=3341827 RepID=UPI0036D3D282
MNTLNIDWKPEFGTIFTWFSMDKAGRIAVMVNNCFGDLPKALLIKKDIEFLLDAMNEYIWEESALHLPYPKEKKGSFELDLYSSWRYGQGESRENITAGLKKDFECSGRYSDANLSINKGFFQYHAVEGSTEGEDYPVGYEGESKMGDYFRFLIPTIYASIEDFPLELRHAVAVSNDIDFTEKRLIENDKINHYFPKCYSN